MMRKFPFYGGVTLCMQQAHNDLPTVCQNGSAELNTIIYRAWGEGERAVTGLYQMVPAQKLSPSFHMSPAGIVIPTDGLSEESWTNLGKMRRRR